MTETVQETFRIPNLYMVDTLETSGTAMITAMAIVAGLNTTLLDVL
jgi:hypothetical protein